MLDNLLYSGDNLDVLRRHVKEAGGRVAQAMIAIRTFLDENPGAPGLAYLANMAPRLVELRRVLKPQRPISILAGRRIKIDSSVKSR